jgi:dTMP kinase
MGNKGILENRNGKKLFIVFEGLDGSGKTTLAKMLVADLDGLYIASPPPLLEMNGIRNIIDEKVGLETRFLYYLLGNSYISDIIREARKSKIVVCDRYIHSTLSIHQLLGIKINIDIDSLNLEKPDINFFLFVSDENERIRRIKERQKRTKYDILKENSEFREKYINYFCQRKEFIFIDTSHSSKEESLKKIKEEIFKRTK